MRGTFSWSPPRGGNLNSSISLAAARPGNIAPSVGDRELKGLGLTRQTSTGPTATSTPRLSRARSRSVKPEHRNVSGQFTPPGSRTPSTLDQEHFDRKAEHLDVARRATSLSSVSTPGTLSPVDLALFPSLSGGTNTPKDEEDENRQGDNEDDEAAELREVEDSVAGSPDRTPEAEADQTFILPGLDDRAGRPITPPRPQPILAMADPAVYPRHLLPPGHRDAPSFNGEAGSLNDFLREFDGLKDLEWSDA